MRGRDEKCMQSLFEKGKCRSEDVNIKIVYGELECERVGRRSLFSSCEYGNEISGFVKREEFSY
jgi:hypothetical protein